MSASTSGASSLATLAGGVLLGGVATRIDGNTVANEGTLAVSAATGDGNAIAGGVVLAGLAEEMVDNTVYNASGCDLTVAATTTGDGAIAAAGGVVLGSLAISAVASIYTDLSGGTASAITDSTISNNQVFNDGAFEVAAYVGGDSTAVLAGGVLMGGLGATVSDNVVSNTDTFEVSAGIGGNGNALAGGVILAGLAETMEGNQVINAVDATFTVSAATDGSGNSSLVGAVGVVLGGLAPSEVEGIVNYFLDSGSDVTTVAGSDIVGNQVYNGGDFAVGASTVGDSSLAVVAGGVLVGGLAAAVDENTVVNTGTFTVMATTGGDGNSLAGGCPARRGVRRGRAARRQRRHRGQFGLREHGGQQRRLHRGRLHRRQRRHRPGGRRC